jgi:hypothetical protein
MLYPGGLYSCSFSSFREHAGEILLLFAPPRSSDVFTVSNVADAAHLGGIVTGIVFIRYAIHWDWHWPRLRRVPQPAPRRLVKVSSRPARAWGRGKTEEDLPAEEFLSKEVDPILDKISAHGIQSLTDRERRILEAAREKMAKR